MHLRVLIAVAAATTLGGCQTAPEPAARPAPVQEPPVQMVVQLQDLQGEVRALRNQVELLQHQGAGTQQRQRELYDDLDRRLREIERRSSVAGAGGAVVPYAPGVQPPAAGTTYAPGAYGSGAVQPGAVEVGQPTPVAPREPTPEERQEYDAAFDFLKASRYGAAIAAFRAFIEKHPDSALAGNAQYWIAEAHYVTRDFNGALAEFNKVITGYPDNAKVPDARLKVGYSYADLGDTEHARTALSEVIGLYPGSRVAVSAEARLKKLPAPAIIPSAAPPR